MKHNIKEIPKTIKYLKKEKNKKYYPYFGMEFYIGGQGSGKTLNAGKRISELKKKYPEVTLITNVEIKDIDNKNTKYFTNTEELVNILKEIDISDIYNKGYIIFIDEIHVVLAELFGKTSPIFLMFLSQQRKLSIHIIGTTQQYGKMPKFIRDYIRQNGQIYICKKTLWIVQIVKTIDMETAHENAKGELEYKQSKIKWYIHTREDYERYDTFAVVSQIQGLMKGELNYNGLSTNNE